MTPDQETALLSFLALARLGKSTAASDGERSAHVLCRLAPQVSSLMQDLDEENRESFLNLLRGLAWPESRQALLKLLPKN